MNQLEKANHFKTLHVKGEPLVLYNIWDAGGAKALENAGAKASATGSWSVAASHGFDDGEIIPLEFALQIVERIAASVDLPLTIDFEGAYATEPKGITENVCKVIKAGAIGINFEDQIVGGEGLYSISMQVERIKAVRKASVLENMPLFINARTDLFLNSAQTEHEGLIAEAIERQAAYTEAGADGYFVPGLIQCLLIQQIVEASRIPVNVMMMGSNASIADMAGMGVSRISFGPEPYVEVMASLLEQYNSL